MKAVVGAFNQEKALVGAFSVIVQPVVEPMDRFAALVMIFAELSCCPQSPPEQERYEPMAAALAAVREQRNITLELCAWGFGNVETFGPRLGHLWRTSMDIRCVTAVTRDA